MKLLNSILILIALGLTISSCGEKTEAANALKTDVIPVKVLPVEKGAGQKTISVAGQFTTDDEVYLSFKTGGIINQLFVKEGDAVKQGQLLATLNLTEIKAQVQQAQLGYEKALRDNQRVQNLYKDSVATLEQLQNSRTALDLAIQQLSAAKFNLSYSEIRAPRNGYVLRKMASAGQVIAPGTPVFQTNGAQSTQWLLRVGLSDAEWASVKAGDRATIEMESLPGQKYEGMIVRKSEGVDPASGSFMADIKMNGRPEAIASGMFGKAVITPAASTAATQSDVWTIPYDALLDGDGSTGYVFVTNDNKTAEKKKITIAGMEKDHIIVSSGLQDVKGLIISGSAYLTDKSQIRIIQ
jgi:RND family efflux transporter MFP subunit